VNTRDRHRLDLQIGTKAPNLVVAAAKLDTC
jgi:hypothetical protein